MQELLLTTYLPINATDSPFRSVQRRIAPLMLPNSLASLSNNTAESSEWNHTRFISIIALGSVFSVLTTVGNLMVMVSFKIDKQLQTISNYFLFSLAVADIAIGIVSIPLMTYYMASDVQWKIGYTMCQFWLCLDYLMSNASVLNLLLISFDRYFSVTRPLTYRPRRTARKALIYIFLTYIISLLLWPPWIISWPYIEGETPIGKTLRDTGKCVIRFLETNHFASIGTAIAAFYLPLAIMIYMYSRVYYETKKRQTEMRKLQANQDSSSTRKKEQSTNSSNSIGTCNRRKLFSESESRFGIDWKKSYFKSCLGKSVSSEGSSDAIAAVVDEASLTSSVIGTRANSLNRRAKTSPINSLYLFSNHEDGDASSEPVIENRSFLKADVIDRPLTYTVLIEIKDNDGERPTVRLSPCDSDICSGLSDSPMSERMNPRNRLCGEVPARSSETKKMLLPEPTQNGRPLPRRASRQTLKEEQRKVDKEKKKNERKQESKAAKTLSAILFAFIITWTPYNVIVCWEAIYKGSIPEIYFHIAYALCYINSTINPLCYALCNARFRKTYLRILKGNWRQDRSSINQSAFFRR